MELYLDDLCKTYQKGRPPALDHFSAKMTPGVYALLGPNGAGKSTLMNIIVDNLRPNQGRVLFNGEENLQRDLIQKSESVSATLSAKFP
mgnify:CR=1 FL=1